MLKQLSARELEVLNLVAHGNTHNEIAAQLQIVASTVAQRMTRVLRKLGAVNAAHAVYLAYAPKECPNAPVKQLHELTADQLDRMVVELVTDADSFEYYESATILGNEALGEMERETVLI